MDRVSHYGPSPKSAIAAIVLVLIVSFAYLFVKYSYFMTTSGQVSYETLDGESIVVEYSYFYNKADSTRHQAYLADVLIVAKDWLAAHTAYDANAELDQKREYTFDVSVPWYMKLSLTFRMKPRPLTAWYGLGF